MDDGRSGSTNHDIYGIDLTTLPGGSEIIICDVAGSDQTQPAIDGNIVIWRDKRNYSTNSYDIYAFSLTVDGDALASGRMTLLRTNIAPLIDAL